MTGFTIKTAANKIIRFKFYNEIAPVTVKAFATLLPFARTFVTRFRVSGQEIWIDNALELDIIQENASIFTEPGEAVYGPLKPLTEQRPQIAWVYITAKAED